MLPAINNKTVRSLNDIAEGAAPLKDVGRHGIRSAPSFLRVDRASADKTLFIRQPYCSVFPIFFGFTK
jgi:hypothetical protein